jgi:hypothetical protein
MVRLDNTVVESNNDKWHLTTSYDAKTMLMYVTSIGSVLLFAGLISLVIALF